MDGVVEITVQGETDRGNFMSLDSIGFPRLRFCMECACVVHLYPGDNICPGCGGEKCMTKLYVKGTPSEKLIIGRKGGTIEEAKRTKDAGREDAEAEAEKREGENLHDIEST